MIDGYYEMFVKAVARGRGVKADAVRNGFGEGRTLMATDAIAQGLADDTATLDAVLAEFGVARPADGGASYRAPGEPPMAQVIEQAPAAAASDIIAEPATAAQLAPEAAKQKPKSDEIDDNDDGDEDEGGNDDTDDPDDASCKCECKACADGDHAGCTAEEKCGAHAKASEERLTDIALQKQRLHIALNL
jgi:hypothetical protein